jgi:hypothetical protein
MITQAGVQFLFMVNAGGVKDTQKTAKRQLKKK